MVIERKLIAAVVSVSHECSFSVRGQMNIFNSFICVCLFVPGEMDADKIKSKAHDEHSQQVDREKVKAEREAKRLAKQMAKQQLQDKNRNLASNSQQSTDEKEKSKSSIKSASQHSKKDPSIGKPDRHSDHKSTEIGRSDEKCSSSKSNEPTDVVAINKVATKLENLSIDKCDASTEAASGSEKKTSKQLTKAERRALQETQRALKASKSQAATSSTKVKVESKPKESSAISSGQKTNATNAAETNKSSNKQNNDSRRSPSKKPLPQLHRVKLFNHLYPDESTTMSPSPNDAVNSGVIHPVVIRLGSQYQSGVVRGSNARCLAFMIAMKLMISDYETPLHKDFTRGLDEYIDVCKNYLHKCRPIAVSIANAVKFIKWQINQLPKDEKDPELKAILLEAIDTYIRDQIDKAAEAISIQVQEKISDGDVILTFGCSSVILNILNEARKSKRDFRVIVIDANPWHEGREMLRRLVAKNINCTCVLINAVGFIMPEVTKVLLGAHALLANGYVMSRAGTAQVALVAKSYNVPVLVCCETHKFSERVLMDAFVYNEIGQ